MAYQTKQKEIILNTFKDHNNESLTAKDLLLYINESVSKATLYRIIDNLVKDNIINKYYNEISNSYEYQYIGNSNDCHNHLHLKCNKCGKIYHLDNMFNNKLSFSIDYTHSLLYGTCSVCIKEG